MLTTKKHPTNLSAMSHKSHAENIQDKKGFNELEFKFVQKK